MASYTVYILLQNFEAETKKLVFDKFSITKIDGSNLAGIQRIFDDIRVNRMQHFIERQYDKYLN